MDLETLSCSLSLAFLAQVTGRGYQREGFSGFLMAVTVTERAIARSVDGECPISAATSDSLRSSSVRAIALRLGNSLPYTSRIYTVGWFHAPFKYAEVKGHSISAHNRPVDRQTGYRIFSKCFYALLFHRHLSTFHGTPLCAHTAEFSQALL